MNYTFADLINLSPERLITALGGFYECPSRVRADGRIEWLGPLAGYTSRDAQGRQRLGPHYVSFEVVRLHEPARAVVAQWMMWAVAETMRQHPSFRGRYGFCGIPTGGKAIVDMIRLRSAFHCICAEKAEEGEGTATARATKKLWFPPGQEPQAGQCYVLGEDVGNAFSTTAEIIKMVESYGARVVAVVVFLNRSMTVEDTFLYAGRPIPVIALWRKPMPIYEMDDPEVCEAVAAGNYVLKPKAEWSRLMRVMQEYQRHGDLVLY